MTDAVSRVDFTVHNIENKQLYNVFCAGESISFSVIDNTVFDATLGKENHSTEKRAEISCYIADLFSKNGWTVGLPPIPTEKPATEDTDKYEKTMNILGLTFGSVKNTPTQYYSLYTLPNNLHVKGNIAIPAGAKIPNNLTIYGSLFLNNTIKVFAPKGLRIHKHGVIYMTKALTAISPRIPKRWLGSDQNHRYQTIDKDIPFVGKHFIYDLPNYRIAKLRQHYSQIIVQEQENQKTRTV